MSHQSVGNTEPSGLTYIEVKLNEAQREKVARLTKQGNFKNHWELFAFLVDEAPETLSITLPVPGEEFDVEALEPVDVLVVPKELEKIDRLYRPYEGILHSRASILRILLAQAEG